MKISKSIFGCGMAVALAANVANAQEVPEEKAQLPIWMENLYLGGSVGATTTMTDIKQYDLYPVTSYRNEIGFGGDFYVGYTLTSAISLEGRLAGYGMNGTDRTKDVWFTGGSFNPSLNVKFNFSNIFFSGNGGDNKFAFSGYLGAGLSMFRSRQFDLNHGNVDEDPWLSGQGYLEKEKKTDRTQEISIPLGLQVAYKLNKKLDIFFDQRVVSVLTDKLDARIEGNSPFEFITYSALGVNYRFSEKQWVKPEKELFDKIAKVDSILDGFKDSDNDGVIDTYDKDNKTPEGAKTTGDGMAMDTDGDGVADYIDQERLSLCSEVDENGVALDTDGDGVPNCKDKEPNTEAGAQVDINGKTISAGLPVATGGNEDSKATGADVGLPSVYFKLGSGSIDYTNYPALTEVAKFLKKNKDAKLTVVGHTDATGPEDFNKKLGEKRAQSVIDHLVKIYGIDASRLTAVSEGSSNALAVKKNARANRRVDFLYTK